MQFRSSRNAFVLLALGSVFALASLRARAEDRRPELAAAEQAIFHAQGELGAVLDRVARLRAEIAQVTGRVDVSPEGIRAAVGQLQQQQEQLMLDEAGAQGRRQGLEQAIKEYSNAASNRASSDEAVKQLESVLAIRETELKRKLQLQKVGAIAADELGQAEAAVAQARADVADAKHRIAGDVGPNSALDVWNRELMNLSIEQMERRARLDYIRNRLDKYSQVMAAVSDLERTAGEQRAIDARIEASRQRLDILRASEAATEAATPTQPNTHPAQTQGK
jgi:chromosome segregation ATPase